MSESAFISTFRGIWRFVLRRRLIIIVSAVIAAIAVFLIVLFISTGQRPTLVTPASGEEASANPLSLDSGESGKPWKTPGLAPVEGVLTFRGNPTRSYYGEGPVPRIPETLWHFPVLDDNTPALCGESETNEGDIIFWCGTGWTGQPTIVERIDATTNQKRKWLIFGAYDWKVHFLDADTGEPIIAPFATGDIIKTSVTIDPHGFPLIYFGSRDNDFRIVSFDQGEPIELWSLNAYDERILRTLWNDDWDSSPLIINDYLFVGGENGNMFIIRLNREYDSQGFVQINPELLHILEGWDDQLLQDVGDSNVSIEGSPVIVNSILYFANSGGLIQGWDISDLDSGERPERVFRYWVGDDTDSTLVADKKGMLYVGIERERLVENSEGAEAGGDDYSRANARSDEVGQIIKIDPTVLPTPENPHAPLIWSVFDKTAIPSGVWSTLALYKDRVYATTETGRVIAISADSGEILWEEFFPGIEDDPATEWEETYSNRIWSSPVALDDVLIVIAPNIETRSYNMIAYDLSVDVQKGEIPPRLWTLEPGGTVESTPLVWKGRIYIGTRSGYMLALGNPRS